MARVWTGNSRFDLSYHSSCRPIEPIPNRFGPSDRTSSPRENQKCRLECVLRILDVPQAPSTDAPDKSAMPFQQSRERVCVFFLCVAFEETTVRLAHNGPRRGKVSLYHVQQIMRQAKSS
jgi:hypothetical protein